MHKRALTKPPRPLVPGTLSEQASRPYSGLCRLGRRSLYSPATREEWPEGRCTDWTTPGLQLEPWRRIGPRSGRAAHSWDWRAQPARKARPLN